MSTFNRNGIREIDFLLAEEEINEIRNIWTDHLHSISIYPSDYFRGRGIVMCGGGVTYFTCAWIAIKNLRYLGCRLPVEFWYLGNELSEQCIEQLSDFDVECRDFLNFEETELTGVMLKPLAIKLSRFKDILFLDCDNNCLRDPSFFFETEEFKKIGAIFWPDFWLTAVDNPIWKIIGSDKFFVKEQESGQLLINKERCWKELNLALFFNQRNEIFHQLLFGDKDTFKFAWDALGSSFVMIGVEPASCGYLGEKQEFLGVAMIQHDLDDRPLFVHRNLVKWDVTRDNEMLFNTIKMFKSNTKNREYKLGYSKKGSHFFMDLNGEILQVKVNQDLIDMEKRSLDYLSHLRDQKFYHEFLLHCHLATERFKNRKILQKDLLAV